MDNFNYTISIIQDNKQIERLNYDNEEAATKIYKTLHMIACYYISDIYGIQLWQHRKDKTIDEDPHARILKQFYK